MKIFIETYGCTANQADSTAIKNALLSQGHTIADNPDNADTIIINTCAVTQHTSRSMLKAIKKYAGKHVIAAGCMAAAQPYMLNGIEHADKAGPQAALSHLGIEARCDEVPVTITGNTAIIPISEGCNGNCSYCIVKLARGKLHSYSIDAVLKSCREALEAGATEIFITSQDTGAYGIDIGTRLPELINEIVNLPGEYKIRLGMMNPFSIADIMPDMVEAIKHPRVYRFIHLPVQSGSDRILMLMGRPYTTKEYNSMIEYFRKNIPDITFSTDYIVGFPTETDDDFKMTMESLRINLPLKVNITRYSPRPGTKAEKMPDILERTKKERSRMLTGLHHNITSSFMKSSIGKHKNVLITEKGKDGSVIAKDDSYNMIVIREALSPGIRVNVEIIGSGVTYMIGKII